MRPGALWVRMLRARGIEVPLLPAQYARAYVKRSKADAADCVAPLEATRANEALKLQPIPGPCGSRSIAEQMDCRRTLGPCSYPPLRR